MNNTLLLYGRSVVNERVVLSLIRKFLRLDLKRFRYEVEVIVG